MKTSKKSRLYEIIFSRKRDKNEIRTRVKHHEKYFLCSQKQTSFNGRCEESTDLLFRRDTVGWEREEQGVGYIQIREKARDDQLLPQQPLRLAWLFCVMSMAWLRAGLALLGPALTPSHLEKVLEGDRCRWENIPFLHVNASFDEHIIDLASDECKRFLHV